MEKKQVPAIRFQGFTDAWEQRKLSDCAGFRRGSFPQPYGNKEWYDGEGSMPFVQVADVSNDMKLVNNTKQKISKLAQPMSVFAEKGSVLVTLQGSIGRVAITQYGAFVDRTVLIFDKYKDDIDKRFWAYIIKEKFEDEARKAPGGTIKTITKEALSDFDLMLPCYAEQRKLADYLLNIDHLITLHQRKYEKLLKVKKSMLEKMFPRDGADVPEIRFDEFADAWEQRKLSELAEKTYGGGTPTTSNEAYWNGDIPWIQSSDVVDGKLFGVTPRKHITQSGLSSSAAQLIPKNSIAIITRVGVGKLAFMPYSYATSQDFLSLSKLNAEPFFTVYSCYKKLQSELNSVQGTSIKGITKDELLSKAIMVPEYAEQQQIGAFFSSLDHLITLHQRELEKLKNIKKSLLEKMFV